jgi:hypothetical protein
LSNNTIVSLLTGTLEKNPTSGTRLIPLRIDYLVHSALRQFPVSGPQLRHSSLNGSALALGLAAALWAGGDGGLLAAQNAMTPL